jgi:hypothetical protein
MKKAWWQVINEGGRRSCVLREREEERDRERERGRER